jgi:hypothetical protein
VVEVEGLTLEDSLPLGIGDSCGRASNRFDEKFATGDVLGVFVEAFECLPTAGWEWSHRGFAVVLRPPEVGMRKLSFLARALVKVN